MRMLPRAIKRQKHSVAQRGELVIVQTWKKEEGRKTISGIFYIPRGESDKTISFIYYRVFYFLSSGFLTYGPTSLTPSCFPGPELLSLIW